MREQIFDFLEDDVPEAPETCVICGAPLDLEATGVIRGYDDDGCTCSATCHAKNFLDRAEHCAAENAAQYQEWLEDERAGKFG
jgi:hypothetical protein